MAVFIGVGADSSYILPISLIVHQVQHNANHEQCKAGR
jgi:hypothetical protein